MLRCFVVLPLLLCRRYVYGSVCAAHVFVVYSELLTSPYLCRDRACCDECFSFSIALCLQDDYQYVTLLAEQGVIMSYHPEQVESTLLVLDDVLATARKEVKKLHYVPAYVKKAATAALKL